MVLRLRTGAVCHYVPGTAVLIVGEHSVVLTAVAVDHPVVSATWDAVRGGEPAEDIVDILLAFGPVGEWGLGVVDLRDGGRLLMRDPLRAVAQQGFATSVVSSLGGWVDRELGQVDAVALSAEAQDKDREGPKLSDLPLDRGVVSAARVTVLLPRSAMLDKPDLSVPRAPGAIRPSAPRTPQVIAPRLAMPPVGDHIPPPPATVVPAPPTPVSATSTNGSGPREPTGLDDPPAPPTPPQPIEERGADEFDDADGGRPPGGDQPPSAGTRAASAFIDAAPDLLPPTTPNTATPRPQISEPPHSH